ncbi:MAG: flagellar hook protein FlgE [Burkholderiaceae bacterium]
MGFQQGLSGLNAASKSLDVIGNNVANSGTVGFKGAEAQFADVYASSLTGAGTSQVGIGTQVTQVAQQFTQGNITASNNPLDIAINGGGFFRMDNNGAITYGRNGQFQLDKSGYIINSNGARLTGYIANSAGVLSTGAPADLNINTADIAPQVTTKIGAILNLDSRSPVIASTFVATDPTTYNNATSVTVYDTLGNSHVLQTYFQKTAASTWKVYASLDGNATPAFVPPATQAAVGTVTFTGAGAISSVAPTNPLSLSLTVGTGATSPFTVSLDYTGTTQYGANFGVNSLTQDGFTSGHLSGFNVSADGTIVGSYTNGKSATLGQVVLANFTDPNGLQSLGNNVWAATAASGAALVGPPASGSLGVLQSSAVEDSNVDLTAELVNMITAQRNYQANAQTIKTQDQVLQTLVNLR